MEGASNGTFLERIAELPDVKPLATLTSGILGSLGASEETHALAEAAVMLSLSRSVARHALAGDESAKQSPSNRRERFQTALREIEALAKVHDEHLYVTCCNALRELYADERVRDPERSSDAGSDSGSDVDEDEQLVARLAERLAVPMLTERRIVQRTLACPEGGFRTDQANEFVKRERLRCLGMYPEEGGEDESEGVGEYWTNDVVADWNSSFLTIEDVANIVYDDVHVVAMPDTADYMVWLTKAYVDAHAQTHPYPATREEALAARKIGVFCEEDGRAVDVSGGASAAYVLVTPDLVSIAKLIDAEASRIDDEAASGDA